MGKICRILLNAITLLSRIIIYVSSYNLRDNMTKGDFEIWAPPFIAGGDPKGADLRKEGIHVPSLRGALRFGFRAKRGRGK